MAIEGFDYKEFAEMMSSQAEELVPPNFNDMQKEYVVKTLTNFTLLAGEAISNDTKLNFNADQAVFVLIGPGSLYVRMEITGEKVK